IPGRPGEEPVDLQLWNSTDYRPLGPPTRLPSVTDNQNFDPDGNQIVTKSRDGRQSILQVFDVIKGRVVNPRRLLEAGRGDVAFHPNGRAVLAAGPSGGHRLWDVHTGEPVGPPLLHQDLVTIVTFHRDGKLVATGGVDRTAQVWDVATGQPVG